MNKNRTFVPPIPSHFGHTIWRLSFNFFTAPLYSCSNVTGNWWIISRTLRSSLFRKVPRNSKFQLKRLYQVNLQKDYPHLQWGNHCHPMLRHYSDHCPSHTTMKCSKSPFIKLWVFSYWNKNCTAEEHIEDVHWVVETATTTRSTQTLLTTRIIELSFFRIRQNLKVNCLLATSKTYSD